MAQVAAEAGCFPFPRQSYADSTTTWENGRALGETQWTVPSRINTVSTTAALRTLLTDAAWAAIAAVRPAVCIERSVRRSGDRLTIGSESVDLSCISRLLVVGMGKASAAMAAALEDVLGHRIDGGLVVTADGYAVPTNRIEIREASHPVPDARGVAATAELADVVRQAGKDDLVIVLVSGGGSALLTQPMSGISIEDLAATNNLVLRAGVPIREMNTVRKHLSALQGGRLAMLAYPARVVSLILSDVPGDRLDTIASGPTSPDPTTFADAHELATRAGIWDQLPASVRDTIERGRRGEIEETPKPGDVRFIGVSNAIIGSGRIAAEAARAYALDRGYRSVVLTTTLQGEARAVGPILASIGRHAMLRGDPVSPPALIVAGGETTVTVAGFGCGGRNQEVALSAAAAIDGLDGIAIASVGTDGRDGPTDAAGGIVDGGSAARLRAAGVQIDRALAENASYDALAASGDLLSTGPTLTNVADLLLIACHAVPPAVGSHPLGAR